MKRLLLLSAALVVSTGAVAQERIAITGGKVITNTGAPIEGGTVLLNDGVVVGVQAGTSVPAGYRQVDATGKWVTPGIVAGLSQIGSAEDVKGSVDANTRMQLETARTINELIGVSNGAVSALNTEMQMRLTQQSETAKMLQYKDINPFK